MTAAEIQTLRERDEYDYFEYPRLLYRDRPKGHKTPRDGAWVAPDEFETLIVNSEDEEVAALDSGYRTTPLKEKANA